MVSILVRSIREQFYYYVIARNFCIDLFFDFLTGPPNRNGLFSACFYSIFLNWGPQSKCNVDWGNLII